MNIVELTDKIENLGGLDPSGFDCLDGLPRAYMEIPTYDGEGKLIWARLVYRVIGLGIEGNAIEDPTLEDRLCQAVWLEVLKLRENFAKRISSDITPILFWRRKPCLTPWKLEDKPVWSELSMRLCIPGLLDEDYRNLSSYKAQGADTVMIP